MNCILNVTEHEYDAILQINHDAVVWNMNDRRLLARLQKMFGKSVVKDMAQYGECRMQKQNDVDAHSRVEPAMEPEEQRHEEVRRLQESVNTDIGVGD